GRGPNGGSWRHGSERQSSGKKSHLLSLASVKPQATDWLWQDRIPRGALTISTGLPGIGKSHQICDRIARITTGRNWPDGSPCP
ncbi:UNVERIFIED_CONTAM: AAA family ATPase, partial [Bacteroidetes bacterium 56_B9]